MSINISNYNAIKLELENMATLVAVSKTKPVEDIAALYHLGQKDFGENYVKELEEKHLQLPNDIRWHFIGHLQSNKVKYIAPFVHLIHGVDSLKLLIEIDKQAKKNNRIINCLIQIYIAKEETKFGMDEIELISIFKNQVQLLKNIHIVGLMGMASNSNNMEIINNEFAQLNKIYKAINTILPINNKLTILSMGMSNDYKLAILNGSTMVRIGSLLFGNRIINNPSN